MAHPSRRPPGRPRSQASHDAILSAVQQLVAEQGYPGVTIDAIAARAGVAKQTIYRWWKTKADVVLEATAAKPDLFVPTVDHGSYAVDLRAFLQTGFAMANQAQTADLLRGLMIEAQTSPEFGERFRTTFLQPRREAFAVITDRAAKRGDLPPRPAATNVADIVFGTLWYRLLATRQKLDDELVDDLVEVLTCP